ncbi:MAG: amidohydrolase family protein, partial [Thermoanaerobaculia bacterium]|nr:amidohydrolase family protein [Thermoanaerobaculia bacterium]
MSRDSVRAALTWTGSGFESDIRIEIEADGTIGSVSKDGASAVDLELPDEALLPGMINAHSHSFQRGMRGKTERFPSGKGSFWTWRETMYGMVESLTDEEMYEWNLAAFEEMRDAGITTVGEFHYFHHSSAEDRDYGLDRVVLN